MHTTHKVHFTHAGDGLLQVIDFAPSPIMIVDDLNEIVWMNTAADSILHKHPEPPDNFNHKDEWGKLMIPLIPGFPSPSELLSSPDYEHTHSIGPFKVLLPNDASAQVDIKKVKLGDKDYACCYAELDTG